MAFAINWAKPCPWETKNSKELHHSVVLNFCFMESMFMNSFVVNKMSLALKENRNETALSLSSMACFQSPKKHRFGLEGSFQQL